MAQRPGLLVIFDGWAWGDAAHPCNAVARARTPTFERLRATCPHVDLENHGEAVGLPAGQMGNSEVGHMAIGAGRVVLQDLERIHRAVRDGTFGQTEGFRAAVAHVRKHRSRLHLMGLLGPGGIHAHESHMGAALKAAAAAGLRDVWIHPIGDGRDTPPRSAMGYLETLRQQIAAAGVGAIADIAGRYFAMDRDRRWDRTERAFRLYSQGEGLGAASAEAAVEAAYGRGEGDEFVQPTSIDRDGAVRDLDAVVWLNFRPDRSRQITQAFCEPGLAPFAKMRPRNVLWVCTTLYDRRYASWPGVAVAFAPARVDMTLAEHLSRLGLTQFHAAETEKYAHVTYFLNGGQEEPFAGETRKLVPSPKVATYDLQPEMSAYELTDEVLQALGTGGHDFVVVNFANPDMVGHTGKMAPTVAAMEVMDNCLNRLVSTASELGFVTLITSDHGNAEEMCRLGKDGQPAEPMTKHTLNPSPLIVVNAGPVQLRGGSLCSVAPTILELMGLPVPPQMTAPSLLAGAPAPARAARQSNT